MSGSAVLDRGGKVPGIYLAPGTGLLCRIPDGCIQRFAAHPTDPYWSGMERAIATRNDHEMRVHGYVHPKAPVEDRRTIRNTIHQQVVSAATGRKPL